MSVQAHMRPNLHLTAWHRRLIIGAAVALSSQLYLSVWAEGFRVSAAAILYPILLMTMMRSSHLPDTGWVTGLCVMAVRIALDLLSGVPVLHALRLEFPAGVFYLCYDCLLCLFIRDRRSVSHLRMGAAFWVCDFCSNALNLFLSGGVPARTAGEAVLTNGLPAQDTGGMILSLAALALARALAAAVALWAAWYYHQLLLRQEHERRYQRLFLMTAELKNELYFLKKDSEDIEGVMSRAYQLYEHLGELEVPEEERALTLSIAREVHEIKKDNLRIIRGLEGEVADAYDQEQLRLSDLLRILEDSTRRVLGEGRQNIRLECWCGADMEIREHYRLLSVMKNLVTNAVEAIQSGSGKGTVRAEIRPEGEQLVLTVRDDGPGIPPRAMRSLFQVGYSTKFDPETGNIGRGVGLSAVKFLVDELGGTIQVDSQPGQGALFTVKLPLAAVRGE